MLNWDATYVQVSALDHQNQPVKVRFLVQACKINPRNLDVDLTTGASVAPDHQIGLHRPLEKEHFLIKISFGTLRIDRLQINNEA